MPMDSAVALQSRWKTCVCTATEGTPSCSSAAASPTTVGLQVLQRPTPRMAASPSAAIASRISASSDHVSFGRIDADVHGRQPFGEPLPQLLHEHVGVVEQAVDQIDRLAVERREPRRQTLADDLRRIATRIVDRYLLTHCIIPEAD